MYIAKKYVSDISGYQLYKCILYFFRLRVEGKAIIENNSDWTDVDDDDDKTMETGVYSGNIEVPHPPM